MNVQFQGIKSSNSVNFGTTVRPETVADKFQQELRYLYHNVSTNEHPHEGVYTHTARVSRFLLKMLQDAGFKPAATLGEALRLKLRTLYSAAASDGGQKISTGWASATQARLTFANMIISRKWMNYQVREKSRGVKFFHRITANSFNSELKETRRIAEELRKPVQDNFRGDY